MAERIPALTPEQSRQRIAELEAQGYTVTSETLPDGSVAVYTSRPLSAGLAVALALIGIAGCFAWGRR